MAGTEIPQSNLPAQKLQVPSLESAFCVEALAEALRLGCPEMFNTDQGIAAQQ